MCACPNFMNALYGMANDSRKKSSTFSLRSPLSTCFIQPRPHFSNKADGTPGSSKLPFVRLRDVDFVPPRYKTSRKIPANITAAHLSGPLGRVRDEQQCSRRCLSSQHRSYNTTSPTTMGRPCGPDGSRTTPSHDPVQ